MCAALELRSPAARQREKPAAKMHRVLIDDRIVALCEGHTQKVRLLGPGSIAELRVLFREQSGKRSLVGRRAPVDRRIFPARPEGRRASTGRRAGDANE
jgi:hypothetical protein